MGKPTEADLAEAILELAAREFRVERRALSLTSGVGDIPEWDSLGHVVLLTAAENEFRVAFDMDDMLEIETLEDLLSVVQDRRHPQPG